VRSANRWRRPPLDLAAMNRLRADLRCDRPSRSDLIGRAARSVLARRDDLRRLRSEEFCDSTLPGEA